MPAARELDLSGFAAFLNRKALDIAKLDFTQPLKVIAVLVKADAKENFQGSHDPSGVPWPPLKRPRSGKRHKGKGTPKPLLDRGLLAASMSANGPNHIEEVTDISLEVGSSLEYAGWQNDGTRTIPAREFAGFSAKVLVEIDDVLMDYLEKYLP